MSRMSRHGMDSEQLQIRIVTWLFVLVMLFVTIMALIDHNWWGAAASGFVLIAFIALPFVLNWLYGQRYYKEK